MKLIWKLKKTDQNGGEGEIIRPNRQNYGQLQCRARKTRLLSSCSSAAGYARRMLHEKHKIRAYRTCSTAYIFETFRAQYSVLVRNGLGKLFFSSYCNCYRKIQKERRVMTR